MTGPVADTDAFTAPDTRVVKSFEVAAGRDRVLVHAPLRPASTGRSTCGCAAPTATAPRPGFLGAAVDPVGPAMDVVGNADPWSDLWFYANPIWVLPR